MNLKEKFKLSAAFIVLVFIFSFLVCFPFMASLMPAISAEPNYPNYSAYVNDYAGVLDSGIKTQTEDLIAKVEKDTNCQIAVAIVNSLEGYQLRNMQSHYLKNGESGKRRKIMEYYSL